MSTRAPWGQVLRDSSSNASRHWGDGYGMERNNRFTFIRGLPIATAPPFRMNHVTVMEQCLQSKRIDPCPVRQNVKERTVVGRNA